MKITIFLCEFNPILKQQMKTLLTTIPAVVLLKVVTVLQNNINRQGYGQHLEVAKQLTDERVSYLLCSNALVTSDFANAFDEKDGVAWKVYLRNLKETSYAWVK